MLSGGAVAVTPANESVISAEERLIVALDVSTITEADRLVESLDGIVSFFKIGLWLQYASGVDGLIESLIDEGKQVFLDAKMFDIGETVKEGVIRAADRGVSFVTVHGNGDIIRAAVEGKGESSLKIFSISVLTSLDDHDLRDLGYLCSVEQLVEFRVKKSIEYGCDGVVAAPEDTADIRKLAGAESLLIATPGVRPEGSEFNDHKRTGTPTEAVCSGADYLVVGRPIIHKANPAVAARDILDEMQAAFDSPQ